jgi:cation-transporting ATPase 13A3/4/5
VLPNSRVTAFSNSRTQKIYIDQKAKEKGLKNLTVVTGNVVDYEFENEAFDRVVSIEVCYRIQFVNVAYEISSCLNI